MPPNPRLVYSFAQALASLLVKQNSTPQFRPPCHFQSSRPQGCNDAAPSNPHPLHSLSPALHRTSSNQRADPVPVMSSFVHPTSWQCRFFALKITSFTCCEVPGITNRQRYRRSPRSSLVHPSSHKDGVLPFHAKTCSSTLTYVASSLAERNSFPDPTPAMPSSPGPTELLATPMPSPRATFTHFDLRGVGPCPPDPSPELSTETPGYAKFLTSDPGLAHSM